MHISRPHAALLSSPGMGHLIPVIELGKRLVSQHEFEVTILVVATTNSSSAAEDQIIQGATTSEHLELIRVPPVDITTLVDSTATIITRLCVMMRESVPNIRMSVNRLKTRPTLLVVDFFGTESLVIGDELNIPKFVYVLPSAWFLALTTYAPYLDKIVVGEYVDQYDALAIPGCKSVKPEDVTDSMLDRSKQQYTEFVRMGLEIPKCDGVLINTWEELESTTLESLRSNKIMSRVVNVPVYPIGPLILPLGKDNYGSDLFRWLDLQPEESVIYVSLGSGGALSATQINELAYGLESTPHKFIWVTRPPVDTGASDSYFFAGADLNSPSNYLPEGFLTRTKSKGLVVSNWAPQGEILSHKSIGGFLSHCGWNSALESMLNGVPMIGWPLYAEQRMNATMLTEEVKIAVRPEVLPVKKVVTREEIGKMVMQVMEGDGNAMREKVKLVQESAQKALSDEGSSYHSLSLFAQACQFN